jgi:uncharacterized membrane protein YedE/YeeE
VTIDRASFTPVTAAIGGVVIGVGWGLAGYRSGPALVWLGSGQVKAVVFVAAMLAAPSRGAGPVPLFASVAR